MTAPRMLLLTRTPPGNSGVGGIFLQQLCAFYPKHAISCFTVAPTYWDQKELQQDDFPMTSVQLPQPRDLPIHVPGLSCLHRLVERRRIRTCDARSIANKVSQFARIHNVEMIWAVLDDPLLVTITKEVLSILALPLVITVWDPLETQMMTQGYDRLLRRSFLADFEHVLRLSKHCGVASWDMGHEYHQRYGVEPVVMIHGIDPTAHPTSKKNQRNKNEFLIGYGGGLRMLENWQSLLSALDRCRWELQGRKVILRILGDGPFLPIRGRVNIEYLGWRSVTETIKLLSEVDVAYVPLWFDEAYRLSVKLCFPSKITTYVASGCPILYHGPAESSVMNFFKRYPVGLGCHSSNPEDIIKTLERFIVDNSMLGRASQARQKALDEELGLHVFRQRFAELLCIQKNELSH